MDRLKEYITREGEVILYRGNPNFMLLEQLAVGPGDLWHSGLDQGLKNAFDDIIYQTAVYWWYVNDFESEENTFISWRMNEEQFAVRATVWELMKGFDKQYESRFMKGVDFGYNLLRNNSGIPLYCKGLFNSEMNEVTLSAIDRYLFYRKHFKIHHSHYMMYRKGIFKWTKEFKAYNRAKQHYKSKASSQVPPKSLQPIEGKPTVSLVIPTMKRQEFTQILLEDHKKQSYPIKEAVIVDATPENERDSRYYRQEDFPFKIKVKWQTTKGSCRARNEAIELCTGDYIIFADDDIRIQPNFVEKHIRLLQTYKCDASNGLDIMAKQSTDTLDDLDERLKAMDESRWKVGATAIFSNANSIVKRVQVKKLQGNDVNFDGGYGEDTDFGMRLAKNGVVVLHNPFAPNLHLKPPQGGYRWWGNQASLLGKKRKRQPWELDTPVKFIKPVPSPTITYGILKHFKKHQIKEWRKKHFFLYLFKGKEGNMLLRFLKLPYKQLQFSKSLWYARQLINLGERYK